MLGDSYVPGALVLAHSLRKHGSKADLVVLVSSDVSRSARNDLRQVFNVVKEVDLISGRAIHRPWKRYTSGEQNGQKMYAWTSHCFTKIHALTLTQYEKVCLLDADMLCVSKPDSVFSLAAPAGNCALFDTPSANSQWHARRLSVEQVSESIRRSYGMRGCIYILRPNPHHFDLCRSIISKYQGYGVRAFHIGADEKLISDLYLDQWTHIHMRFACNSWKSDPKHIGSDPAVFLHFVTEKPWTPVDLWPDTKVWNAAASALLHDYPSLRHHFERHLTFMQEKSKG